MFDPKLDNKKKRTKQGFFTLFFPMFDEEGLVGTQKNLSVSTLRA